MGLSEESAIPYGGGPDDVPETAAALAVWELVQGHWSMTGQVAKGLCLHSHPLQVEAKWLMSASLGGKVGMKGVVMPNRISTGRRNLPTSLVDH